MAWLRVSRKSQRIKADLAKPVLSLNQIDQLERKIQATPEDRHMVRKLFHNARAAVYLEFETVDLKHEKDRWEQRWQKAAKVIQGQTAALADLRKHKFPNRLRRRTR